MDDDGVSPRFDQSALITIDTQIDTLDGQPLEIPGTTAALPAIATLTQSFRKSSRPIIHVVRLYLADGSNAEPSRSSRVSGDTPILRPGHEGRLIAPEILVDVPAELDDDLLLSGGIQSLGPNEVVIFKPRWGAFFQTPLEGHLERNGINTLVFSGCNFPNCPRTSIYEASERDFRVVLARDAISGLYDQGVDELVGIGVTVMDSADIANLIAPSQRMSIKDRPLT